MALLPGEEIWCCTGKPRKEASNSMNFNPVHEFL